MKAGMNKIVLPINKVHATCEPVIFTCYGLGSCVGVFVLDRLRGLSGGAHIPLPSLIEGSEFHDASKLIIRLLTSMASLGSNLAYLRAKITGGAQVYDSHLNIGQRTSQEVIRQLIDNKIFIAATDIGGRVSRTARFNSFTGDLQITTSEQKTYCI